jgi:hypothetical protein
MSANIDRVEHAITETLNGMQLGEKCIVQTELNELKTLDPGHWKENVQLYAQMTRNYPGFPHLEIENAAHAPDAPITCPAAEKHCHARPADGAASQNPVPMDAPPPAPPPVPRPVEALPPPMPPQPRPPETQFYPAAAAQPTILEPNPVATFFGNVAIGLGVGAGLLAEGAMARNSFRHPYFAPRFGPQISIDLDSGVAPPYGQFGPPGYDPSFMPNQDYVPIYTPWPQNNYGPPPPHYYRWRGR